MDPRDCHSDPVYIANEVLSQLSDQYLECKW
jgi:hypothetical protein